jgi:hypothetical protein
VVPSVDEDHVRCNGRLGSDCDSSTILAGISTTDGRIQGKSVLRDHVCDTASNRVPDAPIGADENAFETRVV